MRVLRSSSHIQERKVLSDDSFKLIESESILAFVDIGPIAKGHCLVVPKCASTLAPDPDADADHAAKLADLPDDQMGEILPALSKIAKASVRVLLRHDRPFCLAVAVAVGGG